MGNGTKNALVWAMIPTSVVWVAESLTIGHPGIGTALCFVSFMAVTAHLRVDKAREFFKKYGSL